MSEPLTNSERTVLLGAVIVVGLWIWSLLWFVAAIDHWLGQAILTAGALNALGLLADTRRYTTERVRA